MRSLCRHLGGMVLVAFVIYPAIVVARNAPGELIYHQACEQIPYAWFSYVPFSSAKTEINYILITGQNGNIVSDNYGRLIEECRNQAEWRSREWAERFNYILLTPVIPRSATKWQNYTVSLDRESLLDPEGFNSRPDLKLSLMIKDLIDSLEEDGYKVSHRVFIEGFSAGAMFAQRFCIIHPDMVQATACGQCGGSITLAAETYDNEEMVWPVGIADFEYLIGHPFDRALYLSVPQFIYIGDRDTNNSTVTPYNYDLFTDGQREFLNSEFGETDPVRLKNQCEYMKHLGANIHFKCYPGVGHEMTGDMVEDIFRFFDSFRIELNLDANGEEGILEASHLTPLVVRISLFPVNRAVLNCDWWIVANTPFDFPFDWYSFIDSLGWQTGIHPFRQGKLIPTGPIEVLGCSLPVGKYTFYFGVDDSMDGVPDGTMYYRSLEVNVY